MYAGKQLKALNDGATVDEYARALRDGAVKKAGRIYLANPDLRKAFDKVKAEHDDV